MTRTLSCRRWLSASVVASTLMVASATASAQTPPSPTDQPTPPGPVTGEPTVPAPAPEPPKPAPTMIMKGPAGMMMMLGPETWVRFGFQLQAWIRYNQSTTKQMNGDDGKYSFDEYMRRARLFVAAQFFKDVNVFILFDSPNLGIGSGTDTVSRNFTPAIVQDAFGEVKFAGDAFMLEAGLMVVPFSHNGLQSTTSYLGLDVANTAAILAGTSTSVLRDVGFQLKGYEADDKFEWRLYVAPGLRAPATATNPIGANAPRFTAHVQYQIWEPDNKGYVYSGQTFGRKKLLGLSAGFDFQPAPDGVDNPMLNFSGGAFINYPLSGESNPKMGGDEITAVVEYYHYDGGSKPASGSSAAQTGVYSLATLGAQNDVYAEVSYYNKDAQFGVFGKFELLKFQEDALKAGNRMWFAGGLKYFVHELFMDFTLQYQRTQFTDLPSPTTTNNGNTFTLQAQYYYF